MKCPIQTESWAHNCLYINANGFYLKVVFHLRMKQRSDIPLKSCWVLSHSFLVLSRQQNSLNIYLPATSLVWSIISLVLMMLYIMHSSYICSIKSKKNTCTFITLSLFLLHIAAFHSEWLMWIKLVYQSSTVIMISCHVPSGWGDASAGSWSRKQSFVLWRKILSFVYYVELLASWLKS